MRASDAARRFQPAFVAGIDGLAPSFAPNATPTACLIATDSASFQIDGTLAKDTGTRNGLIDANGAQVTSEYPS